MKFYLLAFAVSVSTITSLSVMAKVGGGEGHVVHCSYAGTNSPNHDWSTQTHDGDDTIVAINTCLNQGGSPTVEHSSLNPITQY